MEDLAADFTIENEPPIEFDVEITEPEHFDCVFELYATGTTWGNISGTLSNQADLQAALDLKADKTELESVTGALSDSITAVDDKYNSITGGLSDDIDALESVVSANYNTLSDSISAETTARINADSIIGDSITALDNKIDSINGALSDSITAIDNTIDNFGDIVNYNAADFATSIQGALADTALQPNDNISELNNDENYIANTSANSGSLTILGVANANSYNTNIGYNSATSNGQYQTALGYGARVTANRAIQIGIGTNSTAATLSVGFETGGVTRNYTLLDGSDGLIPDARLSSNIARTADIPTFDTTQMAAINSGANTTNIGQIATNTNAISTEVTDRQNADIALQNQIDAIVSSSDVFDIVGTYAELQAYDIATVPPNDIIKVLVDSTHDNAATYYRCVENNNVKSWSYIGSEGAYYTKGESDATFVPQSRTVNGKALSNNITLNASDVGALPDSTVIPTVYNPTITIQKNGAAVDTFTLNQATAKTINITVPTDTNDLTNGAGYISGISYADVIAALSYTPYDASNPDGFITSAALANYVTTDTAQNISGRKTFLGEKAIYFKQSAITNKLGFTLYNPSDAELGAFEYRPNTISGKALLNVNCPYTGDYVGFRYWGTAVNIVAPKVATAGTYYIPTHITDGNTTVTATNEGVLNISSLLPDVSGFATQTWVQNQNYLTSAALADYVTNSSLATTLSDYALLTDIPTVPTNVSAFTNDRRYIQNLATAGNALTILGASNTSVSAGINIGYNSEITGTGGTPIAIGTRAKAYNACVALGADALAMANNCIQIGNGTNSTAQSLQIYSYQLLDTSTGLIPDARISSNIARTSQIPDTSNLADTTLSNVSSIDSNSAVQTALDDKVNKAGDTMTGGLRINDDKYSINGTFPTSTPSSNTYLLGYELYGNDTRLGLMGLGYYASGNTALYLQHERTVNGTIKYSALQVGIDDSGNAYCTFPKSTCCDGQWVQKYSKLADTSGTKAGTTYSLSSYLPNDAHTYEVKFRLFAYTSSSTCSYYCNTDRFNNGQTSTAVEEDYCFVYGGGYSRQNTVVFDLPVGTGRYVKLYGSGSSSVILCALGYRRIGTNS